MKHCNKCGNPDCPKVSADPYWSKCPAERIRTRSDDRLIDQQFEAACESKEARRTEERFF